MLFHLSIRRWCNRLSKADLILKGADSVDVYVNINTKARPDFSIIWCRLVLSAATTAKICST